MPQGYYVIEQWKCSAKGAAEWIAVLVLPFGATLTAAEQALEELGEPGCYRIVQMQRVIWVEQDAGVFKLRKSHANTPDGLRKIVAMFERCGGRYPEEEVRAARRLAKTQKRI